MTTPADLAKRSSIARTIFDCRVFEAEIAAQLSRCPPPNADALRGTLACVRRTVSLLRTVEDEQERRSAS